MQTTSKNRLNLAYEECIAKGLLIKTNDVSINKIKSMLKQSENEFEDLSLIIDIRYHTPSIIYKTQYDILHKLIQTYLLFDKIKSINHTCLFTNLCILHPEIRFDWEFLEDLRLKRNSIHYDDGKIDYDEWNRVKEKINEYINIMIDKINKRI